MISDDMLAQAAEKAAAILNESLPEPSDCRHSFSPRFERRMKRLLRRTSHPVLYSALRYAASILLVIMIGFGSFLAVNANAREAVLGWVKRQEGNFYTFFFVGEQAHSKSNRYSLGWIPENLQFIELMEMEWGETYVYYDENGGITQFSYSSDLQGMEILVLLKNHAQEDVSIHGLPGTLYTSRDQDESHTLVWLDEETNTFFLISSFESPEYILNMAENIVSQ